jgi:hypothetical protein
LSIDFSGGGHASDGGEISHEDALLFNGTHIARKRGQLAWNRPIEELLATPHKLARLSTDVCSDMVSNLLNSKVSKNLLRYLAIGKVLVNVIPLLVLRPAGIAAPRPQRVALR